MFSRRRSVSAFVTGFALAANMFPVCAAAAPHRGTAFSATLRSTPPARPLPVVPIPSGLRERESPKAIELAPAGTASKASPAPFPSFSTPLRRHRMAIPDGAIPAYGDFSF